MFVKSGPAPSLEIFRAEAMGLLRLNENGFDHVPRTRGVGLIEDHAYLAMDFIPAGPSTPESETRFGEDLARLHLRALGTFGLERTTFLGPTSLDNRTEPSWHLFFKRRRWEPLVHRFSKDFPDQSRLLARLKAVSDHLGILLEDPTPISLLHGDLWDGNALTDPDGITWLLDPAVFAGDPEFDLSMTRLFGRRPPSFEAAYRSVIPARPGHRERDILYRSYHLLHHVLLFGAPYIPALEKELRNLSIP